MKRFSALLFVFCIFICLLPITLGSAETALQPLYEAYANIDFHIRNAPEDNSRHITEVASHKSLLVFEYGDTWCKVKRGNVTGYCKTKWLYRFRSLQPEIAAVPGYLQQEGMAKVLSPFHASVPGYEGNDFVKGSLISVARWNQENAVIHMMRATAAVNGRMLKFSPYVPWENAQTGEAIGGFTTYYNQKTGGKLNKNRQHNIELACRFVDGTVVPAGEAFSFKALCAPFTKANGYKMAPNISRDKQGVGGGVCQLTTTIYNAVLGLPLQVDEWAIHKDTGVPYIPRGFDAAVGSYSDFTFTNTLPYEIRLTAMPQNGALTVLIFRR